MSEPSPDYNSCIPRHVWPCDFILRSFPAVKCVERLKHKAYLANWLNLASLISTCLLFTALLPAVVVQINISLAISWMNYTLLIWLNRCAKDLNRSCAKWSKCLPLWKQGIWGRHTWCCTSERAFFFHPVSNRVIFFAWYNRPLCSCFLMWQRMEILCKDRIQMKRGGGRTSRTLLLLTYCGCSKWRRHSSSLK